MPSPRFTGPLPPAGRQFCTKCAGKYAHDGDASQPPPALAVAQGVLLVQVGASQAVVPAGMCWGCIAESNGGSIQPAVPGLPGGAVDLSRLGHR